MFAPEGARYLLRRGERVLSPRADFFRFVGRSISLAETERSNSAGPPAGRAPIFQRSCFARAPPVLPRDDLAPFRQRSSRLRRRMGRGAVRRRMMQLARAARTKQCIHQDPTPTPFRAMESGHWLQHQQCLCTSAGLFSGHRKCVSRWRQGCDLAGAEKQRLGTPTTLQAPGGAPKAVFALLEAALLVSNASVSQVLSVFLV